MKKGLVALLIALAIVVLVSPGIIGRLAEESMDEQLEWAATESEELVVRSEGFDRGWFSSEGRHRIEIGNGGLREIVRAHSGPEDVGELPALIIDTRIDHGLIPLSSMAREKGTLAPGLGSAVSQLSIDTGSGESVPLPGTIYSRLGLTGELRSNYVLDSGSYTHDDATAEWGEVDIHVTTSAATGNVAFDGSIASFSARSMSDDVLRVDGIVFDGDQRPSGFGFRVGPLKGSIDAIRLASSAGTAIGPIAIDSMSSVDDGRVAARASLRVDNTPLADLGTAAFGLEFRLVNADAQALGKLKRGLERLRPDADPDSMRLAIEADARRLVAAGLELHVDEAGIRLSEGDVDAEFHLTIDESSADSFTWAGVLLSSHATLDLRIAEALVRLAMAASPEVGGVIAMGYLRKNGDVYELRAELEDGLLTVNGAPLPLPFDALQ